MTETELTLERTGAAPRHARAHVRELLAQLGPERTEDATLLISELVTNAVKYGPEDGDIRIIIGSDGERTRFTVHDPGAGPLPEMRPAETPAHVGGGHGLRLVDAVADRWGVERGSTRVWFELDA
jgi:anti-sigma regulatory factor (Ser/Thr protein kinase)